MTQWFHEKYTLSSSGRLKVNKKPTKTIKRVKWLKIDAYIWLCQYVCAWICCYCFNPFERIISNKIYTFPSSHLKHLLWENTQKSSFFLWVSMRISESIHLSPFSDSTIRCHVHSNVEERNRQTTKTTTTAQCWPLRWHRQRVKLSIEFNDSYQQMYLIESKSDIKLKKVHFVYENENVGIWIYFSWIIFICWKIIIIIFIPSHAIYHTI